MTYQDKTFCASDVENHTCDRELTEKEEDIITGPAAELFIFLKSILNPK